jgi:colicin import membrane protein
MRGNAGVLPGAFLILDGMGPQVEGNYRVERVRHEFSRHGYWLKATAVLVSRKAAAKKAIAVQPAQVAKAPTRAAGPAPFEERRLRERSGGPAAERDALAQAAVLLEAARTGSVFCEKCQAARKAAEAAAAALKQDPAGDRAAAAATSVDSTAAQTQASALRNAAQSGAAFCEKCEAARKALAEAATKPAEASRSAAASVAEPRDVAERRAAERQAAALRASAESGTAFCEKCEAAKEARSAGGTN